MAPRQGRKSGKGRHGFAERLIADGLRSAADALATQIGTGIELVAPRKDGTEFPIEIMLSPLRGKPTSSASRSGLHSEHRRQSTGCSLSLLHEAMEDFRRVRS